LLPLFRIVPFTVTVPVALNLNPLVVNTTPASTVMLVALTLAVSVVLAE